MQIVDVEIRGGGKISVPESFFAYRALDFATREREDSGVIRFGEIGMGTWVYLKEDTGEVVSGVDSNDTDLVNSSMDRFRGCIERLSGVTPFYAEDSDLGEWEEGAQRVEDIIRDVDPAAYREGAYWYEFRWEVTMGEFYG